MNDPQQNIHLQTLITASVNAAVDQRMIILLRKIDQLSNRVDSLERRLEAAGVKGRISPAQNSTPSLEEQQRRWNLALMGMGTPPIPGGPGLQQQSQNHQQNPWAQHGVEPPLQPYSTLQTFPQLQQHIKTQPHSPTSAQAASSPSGVAALSQKSLQTVKDEIEYLGIYVPEHEREDEHALRIRHATALMGKHKE